MKKNLFFKNQKSVKRRLILDRLSFLTKVIRTNRSFTNSLRLRLLFVLSARANSLVKFPNTQHFRAQCLITWRTGSVYSFFRLTRLTLRERFSFGLVKGIRKSSW